MTTLAAAILDLARTIGSVPESAATGGSVTTLADTARTEPDTHFNNGTIWFLSGDLAGKTAVITNWAGTTFTFATQTNAVVAGVRYAAFINDFPKWVLVQAINQAAKRLVPPTWNTALVTVDLQEEYTLPAGVYNVKRVEIATETSAPYDYAIHHNWREIGGKIKFDEGTEPEGDGYIIRLTYIPRHTDIYLDTDTISDTIHLEHLKWKAAVYALRWRMNQTKEDEPERLRQLNEALLTAEQEAGAFPMPEQERDAHLAWW